MRNPLSLTLRVSSSLILLGCVVLVSSGNAYAQTNNGAFDIGPRNPGTEPANAICPVPGPVKFPPPNGAPNCVDVDQPPAPSGALNPPAGGAGNVVGGGPLAGMWFDSINVFEAVASVQGTSAVPAEPVLGLGPAFNSNSCGSCHSAPAVGGTSPGIVTITTPNGVHTFPMPLAPHFTQNPELIAMQDQNNTFNQPPQFPSGSSFSGPGFTTVEQNGPVIEVRVIKGGGSGGFVVQPGGVAELFTIESRSDASGCTLGQFPFSSLGARSLGFRIPTPTFGLGLVEATPDATLMANSPSGAVTANNVIKGVFNRSGNDGTITRFGWKAQNKSLLIFSGEASNVEMGVTNELFQNEKSVAEGTTCFTNSVNDVEPEDEILPASFSTPPPAASIASIISSNAENNAVFMRMNAAPAQCDAFVGLTGNPYGTTGPAVCESIVAGSHVASGKDLFSSIGCAECHTPQLVSGPSPNSSLSNQTFFPYSDFALHHMGPGDSDGVTQGSAGPDQFRTAPLWGLGQRIFFFHDGRASNLVDAIGDHCPSASSPANTTTPSEACSAVTNFNNLTQQQQQNILYFLRSL